MEDWPVYRGDDGVNAYSGLTQINRENVGNLQVAWMYRSGDYEENSTIEANPLIVDGILYGVTPGLNVFALDAETGEELWRFRPSADEGGQGGVLRGLTWWEDGDEQRIFTCFSYRLIALDAATGAQIMSFGTGGYVDLRKGLRNDNEIESYVVDNTSPGVVYDDLLILGSRVSESYHGMPGHIRAYDVRTGKLQWVFNTIPQPGEPGYDTWPTENYKTAGGCNAWAGFSIDRARGIVFASTGSPQFDFHGGDRAGANLFANSIIALDAATGKYIWHFQVSHHDLWDYDLPSPPNLVTVKRDGKEVDAVAQITKQGWIFVLDRETGEPLFPIEERPVPVSKMPDEETSATQPFPLLPPPLVRQRFDTSMVTDISPDSRQYILKEIANYTYGELYHPPDTAGIIQLPGTRGGGEWSGAAFDPETGRLFVGVNDIANVVQLVKLEQEDPNELFHMPVLLAGANVYREYCSACHGENREGHDAYPSLQNLGDRIDELQTRQIIDRGKNKMPSFAHLPEAYREAVTAFLFDLKDRALTATNTDALQSRQEGNKYRIKGYTQLKDQFGYYGVKPPWGTLNAVDLNIGEIIWKRPLGEYPELTEKGIPETGTQLFGGGVVTAGGLIFIGASRDEKFRAIDKDTGKTLWEYQLPAGGYATPATYEVDGKQFVVIAAGGGGYQATKSGDYYIAFALGDGAMRGTTE
ncbi:MAG TPA: PQQ-binding-like beta-propeller repeat protein [Cyclobacteriaceae bacterium]|nr:PQQ-binding-like beta-propeller repeat protein [Cyclobacteriaceae bacterium]